MCCDDTVQYSACEGWPNGDVGGRKLRRLARSSRRGTLELGTEVVAQIIKQPFRKHNKEEVEVYFAIKTVTTNFFIYSS